MQGRFDPWQCPLLCSCKSQFTQVSNVATHIGFYRKKNNNNILLLWPALFLWQRELFLNPDLPFSVDEKNSNLILSAGAFCTKSRSRGTPWISYLQGLHRTQFQSSIEVGHDFLFQSGYTEVITNNVISLSDKPLKLIIYNKIPNWL